MLGQEVDQEKVPAERLRSMEGTVILNLTFAIQQDQELGKLLVKHLKTNSGLTSFRLALALSLARVHRFQESRGNHKTLCPPNPFFFFFLFLPFFSPQILQDTVLEILRTRTLSIFKTHAMLGTSPFLHGLFSAQLVPVDRLFLGVVDNSRAGWDHVIQGIVQMGLCLIDNHAYTKRKKRKKERRKQRKKEKEKEWRRRRKEIDKGEPAIV